MPDFDSRFAFFRSRAYTDDFSDPNVEQHYPPDLELEPVHLDIDLMIDIASSTASGTVTTTVQARSDGPTKLKLDAVYFEDITASDADGNGLTWHYDGSRLVVNWERPFTAGEQRRVAVAYRVVEPAAGLYFSQPNEAYPDQPWYASSDHEILTG